MTRIFLLTASIVGILLLPRVAFAANHDVCGTVYFEDTRWDRSDAYGSKLTASSADTSQKVPRLGIYLIDKDGSCQDYDPLCGESDDDVLGFTYTGTGTNTKGDYCFYDIGSYEDIYLITYYASDDSQVWAETGAQPVGVSWPVHDDFGVGHGSYYPINWNITCPGILPGFCDAAWADLYYPLEQAYANILVTAVDVDYAISNDSLYHPNGHSGPIRLFYPEDPYGECDGSGSEAVDCVYACIGGIDSFNNHIVAHEIGHVLQMRALNVCGSSLHNCGGGHLYDSFENEKCATGEGWANFVAGAAFFEPWAWQAYYSGTGWLLEGDSNWGANAPVHLPCYSNDSNPHRREGNVSRFFWDLYDSSTVHDDGNDNTTLSFDTLLATWQEFPAGTGNRKAAESDSNGRNARDFLHYEPSGSSELSQNCLGNQDTN